MLSLVPEPKLAAIVITTGLQAVGALSLFVLSRRTVAARAKKEATSLRERAEKAEKALQIVYAGCGPRLWIVYTRGTEFEKSPPKPLPKPQGKGKDKSKHHRVRDTVAAAAVFLLGVLV